MGIRRLARERAVQFLYQFDVNPPDNLEKALDYFWQRLSFAGDHEMGAPQVDPDSEEETAVRAFADPLIIGTVKHLPAIDAELTRYSKNWKIHRIAAVDRNILRLAIYEMRYREDIPPIVSIDEAIDIAKKFSTEESGKFINGILDRVRQEILRPARFAS